MSKFTYYELVNIAKTANQDRERSSFGFVECKNNFKITQFSSSKLQKKCYFLLSNLKYLLTI